MMTLSERDMQALGSIENGLSGSDPMLASMLNIFSRLAAGEEMPARKKTRVRRDPRLGWSRAMLLAWVVISGGLLAVGLVLSAGGHKACTGSMGTACPSPSVRYPHP
jgi:Protein of unknown function (DUF3040)